MYYSNVFSWTYAFVNESDHPMITKLDFSESENLSYSTKGAHAKKRVDSKATQFFLHAQAGFGNFNKSLKHEVEHLKKK